MISRSYLLSMLIVGGSVIACAVPEVSHAEIHRNEMAETAAATLLQPRDRLPQWRRCRVDGVATLARSWTVPADINLLLLRMRDVLQKQLTQAYTPAESWRTPRLIRRGRAFAVVTFVPPPAGAGDPRMQHATMLAHQFLVLPDGGRNRSLVWESVMPVDQVFHAGLRAHTSAFCGRNFDLLHNLDPLRCISKVEDLGQGISYSAVYVSPLAADQTVGIIGGRLQSEGFKVTEKNSEPGSTAMQWVGRGLRVEIFADRRPSSLDTYVVVHIVTDHLNGSLAMDQPHPK
jgi:hypothetical protein